jgi:hypothetical protein
VIIDARILPDGRVWYRYRDGGASGLEIEQFLACMEWRDPSYPTVR